MVLVYTRRNLETHFEIPMSSEYPVLNVSGPMSVKYLTCFMTEPTYHQILNELEVTWKQKQEVAHHFLNIQEFAKYKYEHKLTGI